MKEKLVIKKRYVVSLIITIFVLFVTRSFYTSEGIIQAKVNLTNLTQESFANITLAVSNVSHYKEVKRYSERHKLEINKPCIYNFKYNDIKNIKFARLVFANLDTNNIYEFSPIVFGKNYKLKDLKAYTSTDADISIVDGKVRFTPKKPVCIILYDKELKGLHSPINVDFYTLIIILVLSFLISLKIANYIADFKDIKNQSRIEIFFLLAFFVFLFLPMSHIDDSDKSKTENRFLAKFKPLITKEGTINYTFGKDYEAYFNDRFYLRDCLFSTYMNYIYICKSVIETPKVLFDKHSNYMFVKRNPDLKLRKSQVNTLAQVFTNFNKFCLENNIKLYILIVPDSTDIYYSKLESYFNKKSYSNYINRVKEVRKKAQANIIFPYEELRDTTVNGYTYFKADTHWTDFGAYLGYKALMRQIIKDFPQTHIIPLDDYKLTFSNKIRSEIARLYRDGWFLESQLKPYTWNINNILDVEYKYYDHKDNQNFTVQYINSSYRVGRNYSYNEAPDIKVLSLGTSMQENLNGFLPYSFKNLRCYRLNSGKLPRKEQWKVFKYYKKDILDYNPQILILCLTMDNLNYINNSFMEEK